MVKKYPIPKVYVQLRLKHPSFTIVFVGSFGCINSFSPSVEKGSGLAAVKYIYIYVIIKPQPPARLDL